jgi:hypothetical protein
LPGLNLERSKRLRALGACPAAIDPLGAPEPSPQSGGSPAERRHRPTEQGQGSATPPTRVSSGYRLPTMKTRHPIRALSQGRSVRRHQIPLRPAVRARLSRTAFRFARTVGRTTGECLRPRSRDEDGSDGRRPVFGTSDRLQSDPHLRDHRHDARNYWCPRQGIPLAGVWPMDGIRRPPRRSGTLWPHCVDLSQKRKPTLMGTNSGPLPGRSMSK